MIKINLHFQIFLYCIANSKGSLSKIVVFKWQNIERETFSRFLKLQFINYQKCKLGIAGLYLRQHSTEKKNMFFTTNWNFPLTFEVQMCNFVSSRKKSNETIFPRIMFIIIMFLFLLEITNKQQVAKKCTKSKSRNRWRSLEGQIWGRSSQLKKKYPKPCFVV